MSQVEAMRKIEVGKAEIEKEKIEQEAMAQKIKYEVEAAGQAKQIVSVGQAEADIIFAKKAAEAEGTQKLAEALKQFNDVSIDVKLIDTQKEIIIAKYQALSESMKTAKIDWVLSGENAKDFFGINLNGAGGVNLRQFLSESGLTMDTLKKLSEKIK